MLMAVKKKTKKKRKMIYFNWRNKGTVKEAVDKTKFHVHKFWYKA